MAKKTGPQTTNGGVSAVGDVEARKAEAENPDKDDLAGVIPPQDHEPNPDAVHDGQPDGGMGEDKANKDVPPHDPFLKDRPAAPEEPDGEDLGETSAQGPFNVDVMPQFQTMDEDGIKGWFKELTGHLRDKGATVRGPKTTEHARDDSLTSTTGAESVAKEKQSDSVYEAFYEWEFDKNTPITVRNVSPDPLLALRATADEAFKVRFHV